MLPDGGDGEPDGQETGHKWDREIERKKQEIIQDKIRKEQERREEEERQRRRPHLEN